jgi:hypothetical protein
MATGINKENPSKVILIAIIILGLLGGYLFYYLTIKGTEVKIPAPTISQDDTLSKFKNIDLNFSVFDDFRFKSLKIFGESPVQPGPTGRVDIFAPF